MASSDAVTVEQYLAQMEPDRRDALSTVRDEILRRLPVGFVESMRWGMISYEVPLERYHATYNRQPLMYAGLANQRRHMAVYLTSLYADPERLDRFREDYAVTGRRLDMGKSCVRFARLEQLPVELVGEVIAASSVERFIEEYERSRRG